MLSAQSRNVLRRGWPNNSLKGGGLNRTIMTSVGNSMMISKPGMMPLQLQPQIQQQRQSQQIPYKCMFLSSVTPPGPLRSQPQYAIFGEKTMLSMKVIPPTFRCLKNGGLVIEQNKKGRILLEWSPRVDTGMFFS